MAGGEAGRKRAEGRREEKNWGGCMKTFSESFAYEEDLTGEVGSREGGFSFLFFKHGISDRMEMIQ